MLYQPPPPHTHGMWDTWLFHDGDEFHLFFLQSDPGVTWNALGRAVSKDLVHWTPLPPIPTKGAKGAWDFDPTLTGCTTKFNGRYYTFYGSSTQGQKIGVMLSDDLKTWTKHPDNPLLTITPPHYGGSDWRDLCVFYDAKEKLWHGYVCAQIVPRGGGEPKLLTIKDKTLVAWVTLANLAQRGGSALTLNYGHHGGDVFDAIVFGERKPGAWMAGSDFFKRTQGDQSANPVETADPNTLVQIAIVYRGNQITLYRNGEKYADYEVGGQMTFGDGTAVVMGLRHLGAGSGARFFAGTIEEARIYDVPLDAATIHQLKPNQPSDPKPLAQWTFEDGTARDAMGTFPEGKLYGGARIANGRLHLHGEGDYLATPSNPDTAVPCVAYLTSKDLIHWEYLPPVYQSPEFVNMEVPDYFELNGRHYIIFSTVGSRKDTSGRINASGCYYVMSDKRDGLYHLPEQPLLVGSGRGRFDNYVARTIPFERGRLLYHHTVGGAVTWGTVKRVRQNADGTLWLQYWSGLDKLITKALLASLKDVTPEQQTGQGKWSVRKSVAIGESSGKPSVLWLPITASDFMLTCKIEMNAKSAGVVWRWDGKAGCAVTLNREGNVVAVARAAAEQDGIVTNVLDDISGAGNFTNRPQQLRVLVRAHRAEIYLNDRWLFGISLTESPPTGKIGLMTDGGATTFRRLRVDEIEPLSISKPEK